MADAIVVPQVGQDLTEAKVVALHVKLGDEVKRGDIVAEVESEKATFEVEAFSAGTVIELPFKVGDVATVLEPLMVVGQPGEAASAQPAASPASGPVTKTDDRPSQSNGRPAPTNGASRSSPLARRVAREGGVEIADISGTGPGNSVVLRDVEAWIARKLSSAPVAAPAAAVIGGAVRGLKPGEGHPVLFMHGFGGDLSTWRALVGRLSVANPGLAIDLPGHGGSEQDATSFAALVDGVGAALVAAGCTRLHIVGHSLGAAAAVALSARSDLDVRSLTLISPAGLSPGINGSFLSGFLEASSEAALSVQMARLVHDPAKLPPTFVRATLAARQAPGLLSRQAAIARAVFEGSTQLFSVRSELDAFDRPCRVILGRSDAIVDADDIEQALPGHVSLHRLEQTGHLPFLESPALVARLIDECVRSAG